MGNFSFSKFLDPCGLWTKDQPATPATTTIADSAAAAADAQAAQAANSQTSTDKKRRTASNLPATGQAMQVLARPAAHP